MFKCLLLLGILISCSSTKNKSDSKVEKKSISKKEQEELKKLKNRIKFSKSLSDLVGCNKVSEVSLNKPTKKKLEYYAYLEAEKLGGDTFSEVSQYEARENPKAETIFSRGEIKYFFKSDLYRCK